MEYTITDEKLKKLIKVYAEKENESLRLFDETKNETEREMYGAFACKFRGMKEATEEIYLIVSGEFPKFE